jgi:hypothetical protein
MREALAVHLQTQIAGIAALSASVCERKWPQGNVPLKLTRNRVVMAVTLAGEGVKTRIGGPVLHRVTPGVAPAGVGRFDWDQLDQPLMVGLWAMNEEIRSEVDEKIHAALNMPFWTTCPPTFASTLATAQPMERRGIAGAARYVAIGAAAATIPAAGLYLVAPAAGLLSVWPRTRIEVDAAIAASREVIDVEEITPFGFIAEFKTAHGAAATLAEVKARRRTQEEGLTLRCAQHLNTPASFAFEEPQWLDDAEDGAGSQRNEWRSVRQGRGIIRHLRDASVVLRDKTVLSVQASAAEPASSTVPAPRSVVVFE